MHGIKQSASEWCYFKKDADPAVFYRRLKEIGYAGVEMVDPGRYGAAKAAGLEIVNLAGPGMQKGLNRAEHHPELLPQTRQCIAQAKANGIGQVIIFTGNRKGLSDEDGLRNTIAAGKQLAGDAERAGVVLTLEVLNKYDHRDYQADSGAFAFAFARAVSSPNVKVLYDIYHMKRMGEDLLPTILANLPYIAHFHIAAAPKRDFPSATQAPEYREIVARVHAAGYRGYWGQEFLPVGDPLDELARARSLFESYAEMLKSVKR